MKPQKNAAPKLAPEPLRQFTRATLAGRYVTLCEVRGAEAVVAFPNGAKVVVPREDLHDVETFGTFGSGG